MNVICPFGMHTDVGYDVEKLSMGGNDNDYV